MLRLKYVGTDYHGWQKQSNTSLTIQGILEEKVSLLCKEAVSVTGCSRTDAGVHALDYVCNFYTDSDMEAMRLKHALNAHLPKYIAVTFAEEVSSEFHSRKMVKQKTYRYQIWNAKERDPFLAGYSYHYYNDLNDGDMRIAAEQMRGEHDFSAFTAQGGADVSKVCNIYDIDIRREGQLLTLHFTGNRFLYNMVRIMTGTILDVGRGRIPPKAIGSIIANGNRNNAGHTAPACGLCLVNVELITLQ